MSDTTLATVKTKEGRGSPSFTCPMLNTTNYTVWAMRMKITLKVHKVWEAIEADSVEGNGEKNNMAIALLFQSIPETLILQVGELDTAKKVWEAIKARHVGAERVKEARLQTLMAEFDRIKMKDSDKIDDFAGKLSEISSKSAALGANIEESKLVKKFLKCLPRKKYIHMVASLEQVLDLNTTSFEDIIGRLKAYEERISEEEEEATQEDQSKLMYANMEGQGHQSNRDYNGEGRGRGRGGPFRGRGRRRFKGERDTSNVTCYRCDKLGHYASECPDRLLKLLEANEDDKNDTQEADELMMHEVIDLNEENCIPSKYETGEENVWYLDNGASNHMTGDRRYFKKMDESVMGKVRFGDDSRIDIKGKGSVVFVDMNGESRTMNDVYFIPDLKSSIISLGQATESGCDIRMRGRYLTMHDYDGKLLVKAERSRSRLYKVHMALRETTCMHLTEISESSRWHARLGHINFETIKSMVQGELVQGVPRVGYGTAGETRGCNWNNKESKRERVVSFGVTLGEFGNPGIQEMIQSIAETEQVSDKEQALVEIENRDEEESIETEIASDDDGDTKTDGGVVSHNDKCVTHKEESTNDQPQEMLRISERPRERSKYLGDLLGEVIEFLKECVENGQVEFEHVLGRVKFQEMRELIGVREVTRNDFKFKGENVGVNLKKT